MATQPKNDEIYTFASKPHAVPQRRKYREPVPEGEACALVGNIMYDRRIVRGNTYAQNILPASAQPDTIEIQRQQEARRRAIAKKRAKQQLRPKSPEPVEGRKHIDVQTELYLEELSDRVEEADVDCQTDAFLDRPPSPMFVPAKTGKDIATQILEGDLFDFNIEVKPILEVLVGKTVEQSLLEVMEEEELANLRKQQRAFLELRMAELVEQQRLEEQERRHREEKERRMKQQKEVLRKEKETADKIAARAFAQSYLADLVPSVFGTLSENGYFFDPVERDVEEGFLPWLMDRVEDQMSKHILGRTMLDSIIREVVTVRNEAYNKLREQAMQEQLARQAEDATEPVEAAPEAPDAPVQVEQPATVVADEQKAEEENAEGDPGEVESGDKAEDEAAED
ncbi:hypothetical protein CAPTEDRAFT_226249 [Capitella teleta]|uniref:Radial spoke head protein 3 homolog n=1 Tax=Capitella teleta TaxID=283909 RepID=R7TP21_CAPTE|nr:hypothetical protein CAPTEDRAFT_226249 [Capitella teleta]|eukprot:ELT95389.1 hypothetical protein CAPTEDRAFT_226249 [Capitella teleta]